MGRGTGDEGRIKLALLQPNIRQEHKLNPSMVQPVFDVHEEMTRQAMKEKPDIIIWPETAIFSYVLHDPPLFRRLQKLARGSRAWLIFGTPHYTGNKSYNSIVSMSPSGKVVSRYDKQQLVPFGEYLPFRKILYPFLKGVGYYEAEFSSNPRPELIQAKDLKIAAAICFESTFPGLIRKRAKRDSDFILLVTNDAWFNDSSALYFHLNTGIFRAIENRKYFIQVGNTGLTAVIDPYGRILKKTKANRREIVTFEFSISKAM
jgi:apolipoprotein N-acyltransferase